MRDDDERLLAMRLAVVGWIGLPGSGVSMKKTVGGYGGAEPCAAEGAAGAVFEEAVSSMVEEMRARGEHRAKVEAWKLDMQARPGEKEGDGGPRL